jgi:hypothetical protein
LTKNGFGTQPREYGNGTLLEQNSNRMGTGAKWGKGQEPERDRDGIEKGQKRNNNVNENRTGIALEWDWNRTEMGQEWEQGKPVPRWELDGMGTGVIWDLDGIEMGT